MKINENHCNNKEKHAEINERQGRRNENHVNTNSKIM
jgi:hypothetical protein